MRQGGVHCAQVSNLHNIRVLLVSLYRAVPWQPRNYLEPECVDIHSLVARYCAFRDGICRNQDSVVYIQCDLVLSKRFAFGRSTQDLASSMLTIVL